MGKEPKLILTSVEQLNADGTKTDITDNPELWFPKLTPERERAVKMWQYINNRVEFFQAEKISQQE